MLDMNAKNGFTAPPRTGGMAIERRTAETVKEASHEVYAVGSKIGWLKNIKVMWLHHMLE